MTRRSRKRNGLPCLSVAAAKLGERWRDVHRRLSEAQLEAAGLTGIEAKIHVAATLLRDASAAECGADPGVLPLYSTSGEPS